MASGLTPLARQYSTQCSMPSAQKPQPPLAPPKAHPTLAPSTTSCSRRDSVVPGVCEGSGSDMAGAGALACTLRGHSEAALA